MYSFKGVKGEFLVTTKFFQVSCHFSMIFFFFQNSMIFPGFPGELSFFLVFQVEWESCELILKNKSKLPAGFAAPHNSQFLLTGSLSYVHRGHRHFVATCCHCQPATTVEKIFNIIGGKFSWFNVHAAND